MKQIAFYGAFDRFNYGDLLFPIILEKALADWHPEYERRFYGIIESDLSAYGGIPTESVEALFSENNLDDGSIVIVVGGEILSPTWISIYHCLVPETIEPMMNAIRRSIPKEYLQNIRPALGKTDLTHPFVIEPSDFPKNVSVAFSSVGGVQICEYSYPPSLLRSVLSKLSNVTYLSVRDSMVRDFLIGKNASHKPVLAPDSAHLMSNYFSKLEILHRSNQEIQEWIEKYNGNYLVFQSAQQYIKNHEELHSVVFQLEALYHNFGLPTALCPIGTAPGHKDQVPLLEISDLLRTPFIFIHPPNLVDIMTIISHSKAFLGSSLHGAITAMSFAVPNLIFTNRVPKLTAYIETWGLPELCTPTSFNSIAYDLNKIFQIPYTSLENKRDELKSLCLGNIKNLKTKVDKHLLEICDGKLKSSLNVQVGSKQISTLSSRELLYLHQRFLKRLFRKLKRKIIGNY